MTDYLDWVSNLSLAQVFDSGESFSHPEICTLKSNGIEGLLYLSVLKSEKSRVVLMLQTEHETKCITPPGFSLRTKVNEYGGKPFWLFGDELVFANHSDQCLYLQKIGLKGASKPIRLTALGNESTFMYTDVQKTDVGHYFAIVEEECAASDENKMFIAELGGSDNHLKPQVLQQGADFYSNLVVHSEQRNVAWVQWRHPGMPWDETELWVADIDTSLASAGMRLVNSRRVVLAPGASVCQLLFAQNGRLFFSADYPGQVGERDFWNVHCCDLPEMSVSQVTSEELEFGYPHWVYGDRRLIQLNGDSLITVASHPRGDALYVINQESLTVKQVTSFVGTLQHLCGDGEDTIACVNLATDQAAALIKGRIATGLSEQHFVTHVDNKTELADVSLAEHMAFSASNGSRSYGFYYPPVNCDYESKTDISLKPPLIVLVHGGPTARAYGHFDVQKQFWTSRGFALLDLNHRGSSGYGRRYRDALYGNWGDFDVHDIITGIDALVEAGKIDPKRVCIRGKSAGGYAVLRALTEFPDHFKAGACYYGIGNLVTLAQVTHKFEKHYTDRLIGETYDADFALTQESRFFQRSPINYMSRVKSAMIMFQGLLDKVVPPSVAQEVIEVLKTAGIEHAYVEYEDEAHGFRQVNNNIDAWTRELNFYKDVLQCSE